MVHPSNSKTLIKILKLFTPDTGKNREKKLKFEQQLRFEFGAWLASSDVLSIQAYGETSKALEHTKVK